MSMSLPRASREEIAEGKHSTEAGVRVVTLKNGCRVTPLGDHIIDSDRAAKHACAALGHVRVKD